LSLGDRPQLEPVLHQALAALSRILDRLAPPDESSSDAASASETTDQFAHIRLAAARLARPRRHGPARSVLICAFSGGGRPLQFAARGLAGIGRCRTARRRVAGRSRRSVCAVRRGRRAPSVGLQRHLPPATVRFPTTLQNPGVGTDAKTLLLDLHRARAGDTLGGIANQFRPGAVHDSTGPIGRACPIRHRCARIAVQPVASCSSRLWTGYWSRSEPKTRSIRWPAKYQVAVRGHAVDANNLAGNRP